MRERISRHSDVPVLNEALLDPIERFFLKPTHIEKIKKEDPFEQLSEIQRRLLHSENQPEVSPDTFTENIQRVLSTLEQLHTKVDSIDNKMEKEHDLITQEVREVGKAVAEGNAILEVMRQHPSTSVLMLSKGVIICSFTSLLVTLLFGYAPISPKLAVFLIFAGLVYALMAHVHRFDEEK